MKQNNLITRDKVKKENKWKIEDLYKTDIEFEKDIEKLRKDYKKLSSYKGRLKESDQIILEYLDLEVEISIISERVYVYANQKLHEDLTSSTYQAYSSEAENLMIDISKETSFSNPELLEIEEERLKTFTIKEEFKNYKKFFTDLIRKKEHILSKKEEELIAMTEEISGAPKDIFGLFNNADLKFPKVIDEEGNKVELTHGRYIKFLESSNRLVRKKAFKAMYKSYSDYKNMLGATFYANIKQAVFYAKARKYNSSIEKALDGGNIPLEVYTNLINTVENNLSKMHKYVDIRKKTLKLKEIHMYDLYTPMVKDYKVEIPYDEAKEIIIKALEPMGKEYVNILKEGFESGWVDVYENVGKRSGAYSWGAYGVHPYVLMNYQDNLNNVFTLAHEMGHAIHSYYSDKNQPYITAAYKIFVAEVASTCNEALLINYLLKNASSVREKKYLINYFLEQFRGTLFRQTMFAEFEKEVHALVEAGGVLNHEILSDMYYELNKKYYGNKIIVDEDIKIEWARIPHFYNPFYVYQYATGFSAAIALSKRILEEGEEAVKDYIKFLSGGGSKDPIDLLKIAGVDMSSSEPIEKALEVFSELLNEFEKLQ